MKICVLGAGVIGVSTAYALAKLGHQVLVIDKGKDVAAGASHANGAQLSYSYVDPFAGPTIIKKLPSYLLGRDPAIQLRLSLRPDYLTWGISFLRNCTHASFKENHKARLTLARQSQVAMSSFERDFSEGSLRRTGQGKLVLAQTQSENKAMALRQGSAEFIEHSQRYLTAEECRDVEPTLAGWQGTLIGGLYSPNDNALDPVTYCNVLRKACEDNFGVKFFFNQTIQKIDIKSTSEFLLETNVETHDCDKTIVCLGNDSSQILKPLGVKLPVYPMQGYSLTLPVSAQSPIKSVTDLKNKIVFANLGEHMRIAGFVDANQGSEKAKARGEQLLDVAKRHWPTAADYDGPISHWTHFRPMTPSGVPVIGQTKVSGLYVNACHGSLGYTFAAGSAMRIADLISQKSNLSECV